MADDFAELERLAGSLLRNVSPAQRRALLRRMARGLQRSQSDRIARQRNPGGSAYEARKPQLRPGKGQVRRKAMFSALRRAKFLHAGSDDISLWVGFSGRAARIASVHQFGLRDRPSIRAKPMAYPKRELIGPTDAERQQLLDILYQKITQN